MNKPRQIDARGPDELKDLREGFESLTLRAEDFDHRSHVQVAWSMIGSHGLPATLELFPRALKRFTSHHGVEKLYHETITWFFLLLVNERRQSLSRPHSWTEFEQRNPDLLAGARNLLLKTYSREQLDSDLARQVFVLPDASRQTDQSESQNATQ